MRNSKKEEKKELQFEQLKLIFPFKLKSPLRYKYHPHIFV